MFADFFTDQEMFTIVNNSAASFMNVPTYDIRMMLFILL